MKRINIFLLVSSLVINCFFLCAQSSKPKPEDIKSTWDFFYKGQGKGPILVDSKLCLEIAADGPEKYNCETELKTGTAKIGTKINVWSSFMLPQGDETTINVKYILNDVVVNTREAKIRGEGWRIRYWFNYEVASAGNWKITLNVGETVLSTFNLKVTE